MGEIFRKKKKGKSVVLSVRVLGIQRIKNKIVQFKHKYEYA